MRIRLLGGFAIDVDGREAGARPWRLRKARTVVKVGEGDVAAAVGGVRDGFTLDGGHATAGAGIRATTGAGRASSWIRWMSRAGSHASVRVSGQDRRTGRARGLGQVTDCGAGGERHPPDRDHPGRPDVESLR